MVYFQIVFAAAFTAPIVVTLVYSKTHLVGNLGSLHTTDSLPYLWVSIESISVALEMGDDIENLRGGEACGFLGEKSAVNVG